MILRIEGDINKYYVQTLCMAFFPGSTFGENEQSGEGVPEVYVSVHPDNEGSQIAYVSIRLNDKVSEATETVSKDEDVSIANHASIAVGRAIFAAGKELAIFHEKDLTFVTENDGGTVKVYAIGQKPEHDYVVQASVTEVNV